MSRKNGSPSARCRSFFDIQPSRVKEWSSSGGKVVVFAYEARSSFSFLWWFHFAVVTAPIVSETTSLTIVHSISGNAWSYRRLVAYGILRLSERA